MDWNSFFDSRVEASNAQAPLDGIRASGWTYRYSEASALAPAHFECSIGENSLDHNEGAHDSTGPDKPAWTRYLGTYRIYRWGKPDETVIVQRKNGYLYLNEIRLITEFEAGLFFTSDGEAVDFRHGEPTWKNIRLQRP